MDSLDFTDFPRKKQRTDFDFFAYKSPYAFHNPVPYNNLYMEPWSKQDNESTTVHLANNVLAALGALNAHLQFSNPQLLQSGTLQLATDLLTKFIATLHNRSLQSNPLSLIPTKLSDNFTPTKITKKQLNLAPPIEDPPSQTRALVSTINNNTESEKLHLSDLRWISVIGVGSYGTVWLVKHRNTSRMFSLKVVNKAKVVKFDKAEHILNEKDCMYQLNHPFIVKLHQTYQDRENVYFLMDYIPGGELFNYIRKSGLLSQHVTRFFAAEIVLAIEYMHSKYFVYRDLKPENVLLDEQGHVKLIDFGFCKRVRERTFSTVGTAEYMAPEMFNSEGHDRLADWWSLGILIFEMLSGCPPFSNEGIGHNVFEQILRGNIEWPDKIDPIAKDLIEKLLNKDCKKRLGAKGASEVKKHPWFNGLDWEALLERKHRGPLVPDLVIKENQQHLDQSQFVPQNPTQDPNINYDEIFANF